MNKKCTTKFINKIEKAIGEKIRHVKEPNQLLESIQFYNDEILKIYQDAFTNIIDHTGTISTLLGEIKVAYENSLKIRDERISQFILQDKVFGMDILKDLRKKERDDKINLLLNENTQLSNLNLKLTLGTMSLKAGINELRDKVAEYLTLMKERDVGCAAYHQNSQLDVEMEQLRGRRRDEEREDPVVLRMALDRCSARQSSLQTIMSDVAQDDSQDAARHCAFFITMSRERLAVTQSKLRSMMDEYSDTVPRMAFDVLEARDRSLNKKLQQTAEEYRALEQCYIRVLDERRSLQEEYEESKERCMELERAGTPRPQWELCADFIGGGRERWWKLARGLSSRDTLRVLLKELGPTAETEHLEYFDGLGTDPSVPPYLRYEGRVRNLRLSRRELSVVINDIWRSKLQHARRTPLQEYVTRYFEERYQQAAVRAEWAYNVCAAAEQALDEPQVRIFWGALRGRLSEDLYWALRDQCQALKAELYRCSTDAETVTLEEFKRVARASFPLKSEVDINNLSAAVRKQLKIKINQNVVHLDKLFFETEEGFDRLDYARELYRQRQLAQDKYIRELVAELGGRRAYSTPVGVDRLKHAFAVVDPAIDHVRMEYNIRWAFSEQTSALENICPLPLRAVVARLAAGNVERVGPRHKTTLRTYYK